MRQRLFVKNRNLSFLILLLFSFELRGQVSEPKGELTLYARATQIGTVANRIFRDDRGREVKVIYYTGGGSLAGPYREELLQVQSIHVHTYDEYNCHIRSENYEPGMRLRSTERVRCLERTATPHLSTVYDARGIKVSERRHTESGGTQTVVYFDATGDQVVAISGELPADTDLASGWGEEFNGFACGIAANRSRGRQEELEVNVSIRNLGYHRDGVVMIAPVRVELRDRNGRVIERKAAYREDESKAQAGECPTHLSHNAPSVGRSQVRAGFRLQEQFDRLNPGNYTVTITCCVSGVPGRIVSNTILLEVENG